MERRRTTSLTPMIEGPSVIVIPRQAGAAEMRGPRPGRFREISNRAIRARGTHSSSESAIGALEPAFMSFILPISMSSTGAGASFN